MQDIQAIINAKKVLKDNFANVWNSQKKAA